MKRKVLGIALAMVALVMVPKTVLADATETDAQIIARNWENIQTKVKESEQIAELKKEYAVSAIGLKVNGEDPIFSLTFGDDDENSYALNYVQSGELALFVSENINRDAKYAQIEEKVNAAFLQAVAEVYGYDSETAKEFQTWVTENANSNLTAEKDGIEFTTYTVQYTENGQTKKLTTLNTLSINILCKISGFTPSEEETPVIPETPEEDPVIPEEKPEVEETPVTPETPEVEEEQPKEEVVENPPTGLYVSMGVVCTLIVGTLIFAITKKKNYFSKI